MGTKVGARATARAIAEARRERDALRIEVEPKLKRLRALNRFIASGGTLLAQGERRATYAERMIEIIREHGRPMRPRDLLNALAKAGVEVGGSNRKAKLTAIVITLGRCDAIEHVGHAAYGLREWPEKQKRAA